MFVNFTEKPKVRGDTRNVLELCSYHMFSFIVFNCLEKREAAVFARVCVYRMIKSCGVCVYRTGIK